MGKQWAAQWKVNSLSDPSKVYTVSVAKTGRWACDCPAHRFAKAPKVDCKHIRKVRGLQEVSASAPETSSKMFKVAQVNVVVRTANTVVIQTRREICLEED